MIETYYRPAKVEEAVSLKTDVPEAVYLAGGTQVNRAPLDRKVPKTVIDIRDAVSGGISPRGDESVIGALATLQDVVDGADLPKPLREAAGFIPTRNVRNQATIGGNIAAGRPDSYLIPVLIALAAEVRIPDGPITVEEYVSDKHGELILDIKIPASPEACVAVKESRSHLALPVVSAAVSLTNDGEHRLAGACIAVGCVADRVLRLTGVEERLVNGELTERSSLESAIREAVNPLPDILGSAEFKKYINGVVVADAVMRCLEVLS